MTDQPGDHAELRELPVDQIDRNPAQPRRRFDEESLAALAASLQTTDGILQPLIVRPRGSRYQLIAGERRWRASIRAGRSIVPAIVRDVDDATAFALAAIENMVRKDLSPVEEARSVAALCNDHGLSKAEIARRVGRTREAISNRWSASVRTRLEIEARGEKTRAALGGAPGPAGVRQHYARGRTPQRARLVAAT